MFSYIKILDLINENISFTLHGNTEIIKDVKNILQKKYLGRATFIYRDENSSKGYVIVCKNQTCSNKLYNSNEIENYLKNSNIK